MTNETGFSASKYALEAWNHKFGADPVREVASADWSECYQTDAAHVFELSNGKFAFVSESGCSCYDYSDADVSLFDTEAEAMACYRRSVRGTIADQNCESTDH